jgi:hypothetical protein
MRGETEKTMNGVRLVWVLEQTFYLLIQWTELLLGRYSLKDVESYLPLFFYLIPRGLLTSANYPQAVSISATLEHKCVLHQTLENGEG